MMGTLWTDDETAELRAGADRNMTIAELARMLGRSYQSVQHKLGDQGIIARRSVQGDWTVERTARLKELCKQRRTASQIARILGGVTRNAVIGKAKRMGYELRSRDNGGPRNPDGSKKQRSVPHPPKLPPVPLPPPKPIPIPEPEPQNITLMELTDRKCKYATAYQGQHLFCGHPVSHDGSSWCAYHRRRVMNKEAA